MEKTNKTKRNDLIDGRYNNRIIIVRQAVEVEKPNDELWHLRNGDSGWNLSYETKLISVL